MQQKKGDKYFLWLLQIGNYSISIPKNPTETSIQITLKNNKFTTQRTDYFCTQPIEKIISISSQKSS